MGWFEAAGDGRGDGLNALVSVVSAGQDRIAGAGVYMSRRHILTCAHVVSEAFGQDMFSVRRPPDETIRTVFPAGGSGQVCPARLVAWIPPRPTGSDDGVVPAGAREWGGDLAVLELLADPPAPARPAVWQDMSEGQQVRAWYGGGQRFTYADARVGSCDGRIGYLDGQLSGAAIGPGYSGSALWAAAGRTVVGLVVGHVGAPAGHFSAQHVVRRSWGFAWQTVQSELERAGAADVLTGCRDVRAGRTVDDALRAALMGPLRSLLGEPALRADHSRSLAEQFGLSCRAEGAPTIDELAALLLSLNRALPTLAESLAPTASGRRERTELNKLLSLGRLTDASRLLSLTEYRYVMAQLGRIAARDATLLPRAARAALPYMLLPEGLGRDEMPPATLASTVETLEMCGDSSPVPQDSPSVPALLRFVEHVAAAVGGPEAGALNQWSDRTAQRLGIHGSALQERRQDALTWAHNQGSALPRVVLAIRKDGDGQDEETYRAAVWRMYPDHTAARVHIGVTLPRTAKEIARVVRDTVGTIEGGHGEAPLIEVVVPRTELSAPIDEWGSGERHDTVSAALGEDFHIALRCPELRHRNPSAARELRRRWDRRHHAVPLTVDEKVMSDRDLIKLLKTSYRDCGQVVLHDPAGHRGRFLDICLAVGVPVILWDRNATRSGPGRPLDKLNPTGPLTGLMERVRYFRVDAYMDPQAHPARPSLVWEDPNLALPPELKLTDPRGESSRDGI